MEHEYVFDESIPVQQLVIEVTEVKQNFTQFGGLLQSLFTHSSTFSGLRPFGTSLLFAGWDLEFGFQIYLTGPSGNYMGWKATAAGTDSENIHKILKHRYEPTLTLTQALELALHSIAAASPQGHDIVTSAKQLEVTTVTRDPQRKKDKQTVLHDFTHDELLKFIGDNSDSIFLQENLQDLTL